MNNFQYSDSPTDLSSGCFTLSCTTNGGNNNNNNNNNKRAYSSVAAEYAGVLLPLSFLNSPATAVLGVSPRGCALIDRTDEKHKGK